MARAIISMGDSLGLSTIGEGVETSDHAERLIEMGCSLGQGYLFSVPLSDRDLTAYLKNARSLSDDSPLSVLITPPLNGPELSLVAN